MTANTTKKVKSCVISARAKAIESGHEILDKFNIFVQSEKGELFQVLTMKSAATLKTSARPEIRLNRKNILTPVGGLLFKKGLVETKENDSAGKTVDNKKLNDLLNLPGLSLTAKFDF